MPDRNFKTKYDNWISIVNTAIDRLLYFDECPQKTVFEAMKYSLSAGGKRLRPILALAVCELLEGNENEIIPFACAIEMIHTYSLIHDDLPAMDNDDYRRGRLTNHKVFGEAIAILAGDGLLNTAFEIMLDETLKSGINLLNKLKAINLIAASAGVKGMIGGQTIDMESEGKKIDSKLLKTMHRCKTGALIKAPIISSAYICKAENGILSVLEEYSKHIGLAFQIKDDILDVEGDSKVMGKNAGSDMENTKTTFITLYGIDKSKRMLADLINKAVECMGIFGDNGLFLKELALYISNRKY